MNTYRIQLLGQIDVDELNRMSPHQMTLVRTSPQATFVSICTDQSGLIGMIRHLHGRGLVLLAMQSEAETNWMEKEE